MQTCQGFTFMSAAFRVYNCYMWTFCIHLWHAHIHYTFLSFTGKGRPLDSLHSNLGHATNDMGCMYRSMTVSQWGWYTLSCLCNSMQGIIINILIIRKISLLMVLLSKIIYSGTLHPIAFFHKARLMKYLHKIIGMYLSFESVRNVEDKVFYINETFTVNLCNWRRIEIV